MQIENSLSGLGQITRPLEWSKTLGNMIIGAVLAFYTLNINSFNLLEFDLGLFIFGFLAVGPLLWGGLYALNDYADWKKDAMHPVKKNRAIPSGKISPKIGLGWAILLIALAFLLALLLQNFLLIAILFAMLINQLLYSFPPASFKKRPVLDLISGSLVSPFFRFYSGWVLFIPAFNAPILIVLFILGFQFGGYTLYRLSGKMLEKTLDYKSSIVVFGENKIKLISYLSMLIGGISYIAATLTDVLPFRFIWLAILSLLLAPLYWKTLKDPKKMNISKMYRILYLHYFTFGLGFVLLFLI